MTKLGKSTLWFGYVSTCIMKQAGLWDWHVAHCAKSARFLYNISEYSFYSVTWCYTLQMGYSLKKKFTALHLNLSVQKSFYCFIFSLQPWVFSFFQCIVMIVTDLGCVKKKEWPRKLTLCFDEYQIFKLPEEMIVALVACFPAQQWSWWHV